MATLPPDCVPVLARIALTPSSPHREAALRLLVTRTDRVEEVAPLIESLAGRAGRDPARLSSRDAESRHAFAAAIRGRLRVGRRRLGAWWGRESGLAG